MKNNFGINYNIRLIFIFYVVVNTFSVSYTKTPVKESINLMQTIEIMLENNPNLKVAKENITSKKGFKVQQSLFPNPNLEVDVENFGGSLPGDSFGLSEKTVSISQRFEIGGKRKYKKLSAGIDHRIAELDYEIKKNKLLAETVKQFYRTLNSQEKFKLSEKLFTLVSETHRVIKEKVRAGKAAEIEELKFRILLKKNIILLQNIENQHLENKRQLLRLMGLKKMDFITVDGDFGKLLEIKELEHYTDTIKTNLLFLKADLDLEKTEKELSLAKATRIPDINLSAGMRKFNETNDTAYVFSIGLELPLYNRRQGLIIEKSSEKVMSESNKTKTELMLITEITNTYNSHKQSFDNATEYSSQLLLEAEKAYNAVTMGYKEGKMSYLDVLDSQKTLIETKYEYLEIVQDYYITLANLGNLSGDVEYLKSL